MVLERPARVVRFADRPAYAVYRVSLRPSIGFETILCLVPAPIGLTLARPNRYTAGVARVWCNSYTTFFQEVAAGETPATRSKRTPHSRNNFGCEVLVTKGCGLEGDLARNL